eukprot:Skav235954  [mRNA]  locus=scaffold2456:11481:12164:+ [translate_table: standard]
MARHYNAAVYPNPFACPCPGAWMAWSQDHAGQWVYDFQTFGGADWRQYFVPQTPNGPQWGPYLECNPGCQVQMNQQFWAVKEELRELAVEADCPSQTRDGRLSNASNATTCASDRKKDIRDREDQDVLIEDLKASLEVKEAELRRCSTAEFKLAKAQEEIQVRDERIADLQHQLETAEEGLEHLLEECGDLASRDKMIEILQDLLGMEEDKQETMEEALSSLSSDLQ